MPNRLHHLLTIAFLLLALLITSTGRAESPETTLKKFLQQFEGPPPSGSTTKFISAFVDLNGDGKQDVIAYLLGPKWCGSGGCTMLVLAPQGSSYQVITRITITRPPIRVLDTKTNGWHDLSVQVGGGGISEGYDAKLAFNGKKYPSNPTVLPARKLQDKATGDIVIPSIDNAVPLYP